MSDSVLESLEHSLALSALVTEGIEPAIQLSKQRTRECPFCGVEMDRHYGAARTTKTGGYWNPLSAAYEVVDTKMSNSAGIRFTPSQSKSTLCCPQCKEAREILFVLDEERLATHATSPGYWRRTAYATVVSTKAIRAFQEERHTEVQRVTLDAFADEARAGRDECGVEVEA